ncbi:hypothetical protein GCM10009790_08580 [Georgenia ruanii]
MLRRFFAGAIGADGSAGAPAFAGAVAAPLLDAGEASGGAAEVAGAVSSDPRAFDGALRSVPASAGAASGEAADVVALSPASRRGLRRNRLTAPPSPRAR